MCLFISSLEYCPSGLFGRHCGYSCYCKDPRPCNRLDGICHTPGCKPGWRGPSCNESMYSHLHLHF